MAVGTVVIIGGTQGLGRVLAERFVARGRDVVITGRDAARVKDVAREIGPNVRSCSLDLAAPTEIQNCLPEIDSVDHVVLAAIERDSNTVKDYDIESAIRLATLKLVGYTEVLHAVHSRMHDDTSVLLFGGLAKERPYPGSTTVTSVNGAVETMVRTCDAVICAWGSNARGLARPAEAVSIIRRAGRTPLALKVNRDSTPAHPLMLPYSCKLQPFGGQA